MLTDRLLLRPVSDADIDVLHIRVLGDPQVMQSIPGGVCGSTEATRTRVALWNASRERTGLGMLAVCDRDTGQVIGAPVERQTLIEIGGGTAGSRATSRLVHEVFEAQASARPDAVAVVSGHATWTYGALNERANQLPHRLRAAGVAQGARVPLVAERSVEAIVALIATLKSGAAYVPLDPATPPERLATLLADAASPAVLTQRGLLSRLTGCSSQLVCLDDDSCENQPRTNPAWAGDRDDALAYVMYTSGFTGPPKGVIRFRPKLAFRQVGTGMPYGRVWLGVWDGLRNWLVTAA